MKQIKPNNIINTAREEVECNAPSQNDRKLKEFPKSNAMYNEAIKVIPGQTQTYMKRGFMHIGKRPLYADSGTGCYMIDVDGNCYIDYVAGLGVLQLGYSNPAYKEAVLANLDRGVYFSLPTRYEIEASNLLCSVIPNAEMVRFLKSGGDACSAAVTLARAFTGRQDIISCGYHGWHEQFDPSEPGALLDLDRHIRTFDIHREPIEPILTHSPARYACVIISLPYDHVINRKTLLEIREACNKYGVLFIMDEIVTGFRLALGGAQEYYSIDADIILLSKALTAGAELAAICGKKKYMQLLEDLYVSTTMGGEVTALQTMINAVSIYRDTDAILLSHKLGRYLQDSVNNIAHEYLGHVIFSGYDPMPYLSTGNQLRDEMIVDSLIQKGILFREGVNFVTCAHTKQDIDKTIAAFRDVIRESGQNT